MKYSAEKHPSALIIIQKILAGILVLIILVILTGTVRAFISQPTAAPLEENPRRQQTSETSMQSGERIFTGIGRIRAKSAGPQNAAVMISIAFPYNPNDTDFSEELASKVAQFRSETAQYFQIHTIDELRLKTEEELKRELLARYNALLRLDFIETLYITDYMIID